jgi:hypothetical protein
MKPFRLLAFGVLVAGTTLAQDTFPGLNAILSAEEKKRAGLSRLSPDELGVIDAALIRYYMRVVTGLPGVAPAPTAAPESTSQRENGFWDRFGLSKLTEAEWKNMAPMTAKVTSWQGGNRFALDNGQVWEGLEPIPFELPGKSIIIEARPLGAFALKLDAKGAAVRVKRVK